MGIVVVKSAMENENLAAVVQTLYNTRGRNRKEVAPRLAPGRRHVNARPYNRNKAINLARAQG